MDDQTERVIAARWQVSRRTVLAATLGGVAAALLGAAGTRAYAATADDSTIALRPASFGAVFVGQPVARFDVTVDADTVAWTVRDLWGALVRSGSAPVRGGRATVAIELDNGYYTLGVTADNGAQAGSSLAVLDSYRLPADSPFGANTHLPPLETVTLMTALGIAWARLDLTWTAIEPPPLAGWTPDVYQANATVALDSTVAHSGHAAVKIVNHSSIQDNYYATVSQQLTVIPFTTYTFSAWVKGENVKALQFTVKPDWSSRVDAPNGTFDWTQVAFQYTFRLVSSDVTEAAWMDDASVTVAGSNSNLLTNPGFEQGLIQGYTFDTYTPYLSLLAQRGIHPLPILDYANPKYDGGLTPYTDAGRAAFAAYATAVMRHYGGQFTAVEVFNEFNAGWFTTGPASGDPNYYAALLASTYAAVKAVDPSVVVVGGVTYGTALDWLKAVFDAGGMAHLDAVSNHPYGGAPESATATDQAEEQVTALIEQYNNGTAKPVWISELGWSLGSELTTAGYLVRGLVLGLAGGVRKFFWYDLVGDQNYGLLNEIGPNYTPRPAYAAYAVAIRLLTGRTLTDVGDLTSDGIRSYVFTGSVDTAVLWSTDPRTPVAVATGCPIDVLDLTGSRTTLTPLDGQVHLTLTGAPVYLRAPGLTGRPNLISSDGRFDVTAPQLVRTSDNTVTLTYVLDNTQGAHPVTAVFTSLGVPTRVSAAAGRRVTVPTAVSLATLAGGLNTIVTAVTVNGHQVARLVAAVVVVQVPDGAIATLGAVNWTDQEFALAPGDYGDYPARFPADVDFTIGVDDPAQAWPYIHPGPDDGWAGSRSHTFTLRFTLPGAPTADLQVVVFLLDTHNTAPGTLAVALNGGAASTITLPVGGGTGYAAGSAFDSGDQPSQLAARLPATQLKAGENVITIDKNLGSWLVYDAIGIYPA